MAHCAVNPDSVFVQHSSQYGLKGVKLLPPLWPLLANREANLNLLAWMAPENIDPNATNLTTMAVPLPGDDIVGRQKADMWQLGILTHFVLRGKPVLEPGIPQFAEKIRQLHSDPDIVNTFVRDLGEASMLFHSCTLGDTGSHHRRPELRASASKLLHEDSWLNKYVDLTGASQIPKETKWRELDTPVKQRMAYECLILGIAAFSKPCESWEAVNPRTNAWQTMDALQKDEFWDKLEHYFPMISFEEHIFTAKALGLCVDEGGRIKKHEGKAYPADVTKPQHRINRLCSFSPLDALNALWFSPGDPEGLENNPKASTLLRYYVDWAERQRIYIYNTVLCYRAGEFEQQDYRQGEVKVSVSTFNHQHIVTAMDGLFVLINKLKDKRGSEVRWSSRFLFQWHRRAAEVSRTIEQALNQLKDDYLRPIFQSHRWQTVAEGPDDQLMPASDYIDPYNDVDPDRFAQIKSAGTGCSLHHVREWVNAGRDAAEQRDIQKLRKLLSNQFSSQNTSYTRGLTALFLHPDGKGKVEGLINDVEVAIARATKVEWYVGAFFRQKLYQYLVLSTFPATVRWTPGLSNELFVQIFDKENEFSESIQGVRNLYMCSCGHRNTILDPGSMLNCFRESMHMCKAYPYLHEIYSAFGLAYRYFHFMQSYAKEDMDWEDWMHQEFLLKTLTSVLELMNRSVWSRIRERNGIELQVEPDSDQIIMIQQDGTKVDSLQNYNLGTQDFADVHLKAQILDLRARLVDLIIKFDPALCVPQHQRGGPQHRVLIAKVMSKVAQMFVDPDLLLHGAISTQYVNEDITSSTDALRFLLRQSAKKMYHSLKDSAFRSSNTNIQQMLLVINGMHGHLDKDDGFLYKHLPFIRLEEHLHRSVVSEWTNEMVKQLLGDVNRLQLLSEDDPPRFIKPGDQVDQDDIAIFRECYHLVHSFTNHRDGHCSLRAEPTQLAYRVLVQLLMIRLVFLVSLWKFRPEREAHLGATEEPLHIDDEVISKDQAKADEDMCSIDWPKERIERLLLDSVVALESPMANDKGDDRVGGHKYPRNHTGVEELFSDSAIDMEQLAQLLTERKYEHSQQPESWWSSTDSWDRVTNPNLLHSDGWCPRLLYYVLSLQQFKIRTITEMSESIQIAWQQPENARVGMAELERQLLEMQVRDKATNSSPGTCAVACCQTVLQAVESVSKGTVLQRASTMRSSRRISDSNTEKPSPNQVSKAAKELITRFTNRNFDHVDVLREQLSGQEVAPAHFMLAAVCQVDMSLWHVCRNPKKGSFAMEEILKDMETIVENDKGTRFCRVGLPMPITPDAISRLAAESTTSSSWEHIQDFGDTLDNLNSAILNEKASRADVRAYLTDVVTFHKETSEGRKNTEEIQEYGSHILGSSMLDARAELQSTLDKFKDKIVDLTEEVVEVLSKIVGLPSALMHVRMEMYTQCQNMEALHEKMEADVQEEASLLNRFLHTIYIPEAIDPVVKADFPKSEYSLRDIKEIVDGWYDDDLFKEVVLLLWQGVPNSEAKHGLGLIDLFLFCYENDKREGVESHEFPIGRMCRWSVKLNSILDYVLWEQHGEYLDRDHRFKRNSMTRSQLETILRKNLQIDISEPISRAKINTSLLIDRLHAWMAKNQELVGHYCSHQHLGDVLKKIDSVLDEIGKALEHIVFVEGDVQGDDRVQQDDPEEYFQPSGIVQPIREFLQPIDYVTAFSVPTKVGGVEVPSNDFMQQAADRLCVIAETIMANRNIDANKKCRHHPSNVFKEWFRISCVGTYGGLNYECLEYAIKLANLGQACTKLGNRLAMAQNLDRFNLVETGGLTEYLMEMFLDSRRGLSLSGSYASLSTTRQQLKTQADVLSQRWMGFTIAFACAVQAFDSNQRSLNPRLGDKLRGVDPFASSEFRKFDACESVQRILEGLPLIDETKQWLKRCCGSQSYRNSIMSEAFEHYTRCLECYVHGVGYQEKASLWTDSVRMQWMQREQREAHRAAAIMIAMDDELSALAFSTDVDMTMTPQATQKRANRSDSEGHHSSSATQFMDAMVKRICSFQNFGVPQCLKETEFMNMYINCVRTPLLGSCASVKAWQQGERWYSDEKPAQCFRHVGYISTLLELANTPQFRGRFQVMQTLGVSDINKLAAGTLDDVKAAILSRSSSSGWMSGRLNQRNRSEWEVLRYKTRPRTHAALSMLANNVRFIRESFDGFLSASDQCIMNLKVRFPHYKYSHELDDKLSGASNELGTEPLGAGSELGNSIAAHTLSLRTVLDRCHQYLIWGIARHIVYETCGEKLSLWDPIQSHLTGGDTHMYPSLLESIGSELQQSLWQYADQLRGSLDISLSPSVVSLVCATQAVMSSALREICCARALDFKQVRTLVETEICRDNLTEQNDNHLATLLNCVIEGSNIDPGWSSHGKLNQKDTADMQKPELQWTVSIPLGDNCTSTCYRCEVTKNVCERKNTIEVFKFIVNMPPMERWPYVHMLHGKLKRLEVNDGLNTAVVELKKCIYGGFMKDKERDRLFKMVYMLFAAMAPILRTVKKEAKLERLESANELESRKAAWDQELQECLSQIGLLDLKPGIDDARKTIERFAEARGSKRSEKDILAELTLEQNAALLCVSEVWAKRHQTDYEQECETAVRTIDELSEWLADLTLHESWLLSRPERHHLGLSPIAPYSSDNKAEGHYFFNSLKMVAEVDL